MKVLLLRRVGQTRPGLKAKREAARGAPTGLRCLQAKPWGNQRVAVGRGVAELGDGPVLVVGPGAIGIIVAARLADAGHEVRLACRTAATAKRLAGGITATGQDGTEIAANVATLTKPAQLKDESSFTVLATKCADAVPALNHWLPGLGQESSVVAVQNGVIGDSLQELLAERLMECTVAFPATLEAPGRSRQTGPGGFYLGPWPAPGPRDDPELYRAVAEKLSAAGTVQASPNMKGVKWSKLLVNSCISSLGVATGAELGRLLEDRMARDVLLAIVREGHAAGRADGVKFENVAGFRPGLMASNLPGRDFFLKMVGRKYRRHRSSSLQSLERGRKTEVDFLNGHIVATAKKHGLDAPVNAALVDLIHCVEAGKAKPSMENLRKLDA